jgi:hypothetical protein
VTPMEDKMAIEDFCPRCFAAVWKAQVCGFSVVADCTPVDIKTEVLCFYAKRRTYGVSRWRPSFYLDLRFGKKYERQFELVLATHICYSPQSVQEHPDYWPVPQTTLTSF